MGVRQPEAGCLDSKITSPVSYSDVISDLGGIGWDFKTCSKQEGGSNEKDKNNIFPWSYLSHFFIWSISLGRRLQSAFVKCVQSQIERRIQGDRGRQDRCRGVERHAGQGTPVKELVAEKSLGNGIGRFRTALRFGEVLN